MCIRDSIEFFNAEATAVDLDGFTLEEGVGITFPANTSIPAGGYLVITKSLSDFQVAYPGVAALEWAGGSLSNGGEDIQLVSPSGIEVDVVDYDDEGGWPTEPDGGGPSLELIDPALDNADPASWKVSAAIGGSPGQQNSVATAPPTAPTTPPTTAPTTPPTTAPVVQPPVSGPVVFEVAARGTTGTELVQVRVNGFTFDTVEFSRSVSTQAVDLPPGTSWGDVELFFGDGPSSDVIFSSFSLSGVVRTMVAGDVLASGQWVSGSGCSNLGDPVHSTIHCRGVVQFP